MIMSIINSGKSSAVAIIILVVIALFGACWKSHQNIVREQAAEVRAAIEMVIIYGLQTEALLGKLEMVHQRDIKKETVSPSFLVLSEELRQQVFDQEYLVTRTMLVLPEGKEAQVLQKHLGHWRTTAMDLLLSIEQYQETVKSTNMHLTRA